MNVDLKVLGSTCRGELVYMGRASMLFVVQIDKPIIGQVMFWTANGNNLAAIIDSLS